MHSRADGTFHLWLQTMDEGMKIISFWSLKPTLPGWPGVNPWPWSWHTSPLCHRDRDLLPAPRETVVGKRLPELSKVVLSTLWGCLSPHQGCLDSRKIGIPTSPLLIDLSCSVSSGQCWAQLGWCGAVGGVESRGWVPGPASHVGFVFVYQWK